MKVFAVSFALVALTSGFKIESKKTQLITRSEQCGPDETNCPGGCCPMPNWYCCPDATYCAATAADCPFEANMAKLMKLAKSKQCGPNETNCYNVGGGGCCPEPNWFCCDDVTVCAATAADCPFEARKTELVKMGKSNQCGPDETNCPVGCCPMPDWFCCPDGYYCSPTAADCPFEARKTKLVKMGKSKQCPGGTNCPGGCCPEAHWFCCDDVTVCAATAFDCPFEARKTKLVKMAKIEQCGPDETNCPGGCCPMPNWYCCPDASYCAATAADCPYEAKMVKLTKLAKSKQCDPDETSCPGGCCPWTNWYCCPDAYYCAATAADCPFEARKLF